MNAHTEESAHLGLPEIRDIREQGGEFGISEDEAACYERIPIVSSLTGLEQVQQIRNMLERAGHTRVTDFAWYLRGGSALSDQSAERTPLECLMAGEYDAVRHELARILDQPESLL